MQALPLHYQSGHLLLELANDHWVLDTGSPGSFGSNALQKLAGQPVQVPRSFMGLNATTLSQMIGAPVAGLLGTDVLNRFDIVLDVGAGLAHFTSEAVPLEGEAVTLSDVMGVPVVQAQVDGRAHAMFFDTGAGVSYFQEEGLEQYPPLEPAQDFYPGIGPFETPTWRLPVQLGGTRFLLRTGRLPDLLAMTLAMAGVDGIVGNAICADHRIGYFPRRSLMVIS